MKYGSVCSGIEAATAAWHGLGWEPVFFSDIERFPRAVLRHHYPDVPLHGRDRRKGEPLDAYAPKAGFQTIGSDQYGAIDILVGGTPCQSFSVAGLRKGLDDDRGNLALEFAKLAHRKRARWVAWENVPGVFSVNGGADFAAFLSALAGWDVPVPGNGWRNSGIITPAPGGYGLAWRVLDAQYFGVAQRRRRVFVIGYSGDWRPAAAVLLEPESLQGNPAPSREAGQGAAGTLAGGARGGGFPGTGEASGGYVQPVALDFENGLAPHGSMEPQPVAPPTTASGAGSGTQVHCPDVANPLTARMHKGINTTLDEGQTPIAVHGTQDAAQCVAADMMVRRLTPVECERLQGFPDNYTRIPYNGKPAERCPDGPRYRALGNSMAVPVMHWLGKRIELVAECLAVDMFAELHYGPRTALTRGG